jgi:hypothetical protein
MHGLIKKYTQNFSRKSEGNKLFRSPRHRREDNIKMNFNAKDMEMWTGVI